MAETKGLMLSHDTISVCKKCHNAAHRKRGEANER